MPELPRAVVFVVLALAAAEPQALRQWQAGGVAFWVCVERRLIGPQFEQGELVRVERALENLELLAAGLGHALLAARLHRLRQFGPFAGRRGDRNDESDGHLFPPKRGSRCRMLS